MQEARQVISPWVSQIIRLIPNKKIVEFEWTIGPIPKTYNYITQNYNFYKYKTLEKIYQRK